MNKHNADFAGNAERHDGFEEAFASKTTNASHLRDDDLTADIAEDLARELPRTFQPNRKERHMANPNMTYGAGNYNPNVTERQSIADTLSSAVAALSNAASELTGITDRLCGSAAPEGDGAKLRGVADGHFAQVDASRSDIEAITETILSNTSRIRGRL